MHSHPHVLIFIHFSFALVLALLFVPMQRVLAPRRMAAILTSAMASAQCEVSERARVKRVKTARETAEAAALALPCMYKCLQCCNSPHLHLMLHCTTTCPHHRHPMQHCTITRPQHRHRHRTCCRLQAILSLAPIDSCRWWWSRSEETRCSAAVRN